MGAFQYKLEYIKNDASQEDEGCFIHIKGTIPVYMNKISKETYALGNFTHPWMTGILNVEGVVSAASQAYRVFVEKSPIYQWSDIIPPLLTFMSNFLSESPIVELPGSGVRLQSINDRRSR